ncbi:Transthyretin-like family protein [Ancylostoma duodenale]|uniref:Transthyretin-like family protein n=1 Tax=Ancylostoma duodenale TaxID=51022 RepID=A0A0C2H1C0_9BILA|nr:Transthyretin-like family protein [Ancylostoma duodenale]
MFLNFLFVFAFAVTASAHTITVRGAFLCDRNRKLPIFVELFEHDRKFASNFHNGRTSGSKSIAAIEDDRLNWTHTRSYQMFEVTGTEKEYFGIMPYLRVMHRCRDFDETLIINLGRRKGISAFDIGDIDLEDPKTSTEIRDKFAGKFN